MTFLRAYAGWRRHFVGRCVASFVTQQGVDRAVVIASQAFTALIPLLILVSALAPTSRRDLVSEVIIRRFHLKGDAAGAVAELFARPEDGSTGVLSVFLLVFAGLSLARRMQRMYQQAWRVEPPSGVRGSFTAALGLAALLLEIGLLYLVQTLVRAFPVVQWTAGFPTSALASLVLWTLIPWLLLDRQVPWRRLLPTGVLTALFSSLYGVATLVYMPRLMETYSSRYGLFGVTLALVGWLLCIAFIVVVSTVLASEFDRAEDPWARSLRRRLRLDQGASGEQGAGE